jgi:hypothetical protein
MKSAELRGRGTNGSCYYYSKALSDHYLALGGDTTTYQLSSFWEQSALEFFKYPQYGNDNVFGDYVYCHQLETQAGINPIEQAQVYAQGLKAQGFKSLSTASSTSKKWDSTDPNLSGTSSWNTTAFSPRETYQGQTNNGVEDNTLIAWASCEPQTGSLSNSANSWKLRTSQKGTSGDGGNWKKVYKTDEAKNTTEFLTGICNEWFAGSKDGTTRPEPTGKAGDDAPVKIHENSLKAGEWLGFFITKGDNSKVLNFAGQNMVEQYMKSLHGYGGNAISTWSAGLYLLSAETCCTPVLALVISKFLGQVVLLLFGGFAMLMIFKELLAPSIGKGE